MSSAFDLSISCQSASFFEDLKIKASEKVIGFSRKHTNTARFIGLPIALCASLLNLAQAVSLIGETLIKGIANAFGAPFSEKCKFSKGVKQILLQFPLHLLTSALMLPLGAALDLIVTPIAMIISPTSALESRMKNAVQTKVGWDALSQGRLVDIPDNPYNRIMKHMYT